MKKEDFRILVADDDESVRDLLADIITRENYTVEIAADGNEALTSILHKQFHLVITDLKMSGATGLEILKRTMSLDPDTSVVIITAYATIKSALEAVKEGAYDYVTKPFRMDEMLVTIRNAYRRAQLIEQNNSLLANLRGKRKEDDPLNSLERLVRLKETGKINDSEFVVLKKKIIGKEIST